MLKWLDTPESFCRHFTKRDNFYYMELRLSIWNISIYSLLLNERISGPI